MSKPMPADEPFLQGYYAPIHMECEAQDLPVTGEVPKDLFGSLYRNGPNPQFAPRGPYHWFAGDGMLHAFHFENGRVSYRNRWVRTPKWELEHENGESLSGAFGNPRFTDPRILALNSTTANTNVVWHAGRLLALEEAHAPFEVDPLTLDPKGYWRFGDEQRVGKLTAHPKIDPVSGEMIAFAYFANGRFADGIALHVIDHEGRLVRSESFTAPFPSMVHDFVVTQSHIIVPIFPLTGSMDRAMKGLPPFAWEPDKGTHVAVIPRQGSVADLRWYSGDPCYVFHPMNAFDAEDGSLVCDMMKYPVAPLFPNPDGSPSSDRHPEAKLVRWTFDLKVRSNTFREQRLSDQAGEFPRLDERFSMLPYRHGYLGVSNPTSGRQDADVRSGVGHVDLKTGNLVTWQPAPGDHCGEPVFIPRNADAAEGDGWLTSVVYRGARNSSDLAVFDAQDVAAGPVALAHLSSRVPAGFHGNWRAG